MQFILQISCKSSDGNKKTLNMQSNPVFILGFLHFCLQITFADPHLESYFEKYSYPIKCRLNVDRKAIYIKSQFSGPSESQKH